MKHATVCALIFALAIVQSSAAAQIDTVAILHFNDTHSNLAPIGPRDPSLKGTLGGIARAATLIGMTRLENPNTLVLHAGDAFIGDMFFNKYFGVAELQLLAGLGFDAMTVGNHEFDLKPAVLQIALDTAFQAGGFPLLSANLGLEDDTVQGLKKYIQPYTVKKVGNISVGIFGLTTPSANQLSQPAPAVISDSVAAAASAMVDTLKAKGCRLIICLSHLGASSDSVVARSVAGIHAIVGGHDHYAFDAPHTVSDPLGGTTYLVQADAFYLHAGILRFTVSSTGVHLLDYHLAALDGSIPEDPGVSEVVNGLIADIETTYGPLYTKQIGYAADDFEEEARALLTIGPKDTPIGDLVTDAFRAATGTDIAIEVGGSTAQKLYRGPIVQDDLFRVTGYGFNEDNAMGYRIATFRIRGDSLLGALEFCLSSIDQNDELFAQVSGMKYAYYINEPAGARLIPDQMSVGGQAVDPEKYYTVTSNELVPMLLPAFGISVSDVHVLKDTTEMHLLAAYVEAQDTIRPMTDGRIDAKLSTGVGENDRIPERFELQQNYPNPFNPSTTIVFEIPKTSEVSLMVFNILGQEIATIAAGKFSAGTYRYRFNGEGLASGIYLCRFRAGDAVFTKRMMLVK